MYELISQHLHQLIGTVKPKEDIDPYVWMIRELPNRDVAHDEEFQKKYSAYWALNGAGLGQTFRSEYFSLMEREKRSHMTDVAGVTRKLYEIPVNSKNKKALQFSFATKLVHMVNPTLPVYDRMVETFYFLPRSYAGETEKKLENLLLSYRFLVKEYDRILREKFLNETLETFRRHFCLQPSYSDQKIIDTLIWKFVDMEIRSFFGEGSISRRSRRPPLSGESQHRRVRNLAPGPSRRHAIDERASKACPKELMRAFAMSAG
jgi:hypothetical protein